MKPRDTDDRDGLIGDAEIPPEDLEDEIEPVEDDDVDELFDELFDGVDLDDELLDDEEEPAWQEGETDEGIPMAYTAINGYGEEILAVRNHDMAALNEPDLVSLGGDLFIFSHRVAEDDVTVFVRSEDS